MHNLLVNYETNLISLIRFLLDTRKDVRACGTYLIFLPSNNDVIYFLSKNNTHLSFPSIKQWCQLISFQNHQATMSFIFLLNNTRLSFPSINNDGHYCPSKRKNDVNYGANVCAKENICILKESNTWVKEVGIKNCWCKK